MQRMSSMHSTDTVLNNGAVSAKPFMLALCVITPMPNERRRPKPHSWIAWPGVLLQQRSDATHEYRDLWPHHNLFMGKWTRDHLSLSRQSPCCKGPSNSLCRKRC